jgi:F-type H+-transporting ATPase subunit b
MNPLEVLGINWKILIGQLVNFLILFYLLQRFAFKPFLKVLRERREKIEKGVKLAQESEEKIKLVEKEREEILKKEEERAKQILKEYEKRGKEKEKEIISLAEKEKTKILEEAEKTAESEIEKLKKEFSQKNLDVVFALTEKFLMEKIDSEKDKKIIKNLLTNKND